MAPKKIRLTFYLGASVFWFFVVISCFFVRQTNLSRLPDSFRADVTYVLYRIVSYQENLRTTEFEIDCQS